MAISIKTSQRLSRYHTLGRLIRSETARRRGIDNLPPAELQDNLRLLARGLDRVRLLLGHRLDISSGYRCDALNAAVGGAPGSQHTLGLAADFCCPRFGPPLAIARAIRASDIDFDQLILEFGDWIHISFSVAPRRRVLTINTADDGYREGLIDASGNAVA